MRYLATSFSLVLGAWRLRIAIDLEDDPEIEKLARQTVYRRSEGFADTSLVGSAISR
jgi:hypothetical protein